MAANGIFSLEHDSVEPAKMLFGDVGVVYGQSVTYTCDPGLRRGYTVGGLATLTMDVTRTCLFDGFFSQTDVLCLSRPCGVPPLAHSASRSDVGVVYGQSVTYTCGPGFEETEVDGEKVCGNVGDCGGVGCTGYGTCVDLVTGAPSSARKDIPHIPRHQKHHHHLWSSAQRACPFSICKLVSLFSVMRCHP